MARSRRLLDWFGWSARLAVALAALFVATLSHLAEAEQSASPTKAFQWNVMLDDWQVIGPIPKLQEGDGELDRVLVAEEASLDPNAPVTVADREFAWKPWRGQLVDFQRALPAEGNAGTNALACAWTQFHSDEAQDAVLAVGHDDGVVVWLNGVEVHRHDINTSCNLDQAAIPVSLRAGKNTLLLKVSQGYGRWAAAARLRPPSLEEPLVAVRCTDTVSDNMLLLPKLNVDLLADDGQVVASYLTSGGRTQSPDGILFTLYAAEPQPAPAKVRIHYDEPGFAPFDETYAWPDIQSGKVTLPLTTDLQWRGRVVDAQTGAPITGVQFRHGNRTVESSSGSDGHFKIDTDKLIDRLDVAAAGYEPKQVPVPWPPTDDWTIDLDAGGHVFRGRVLSNQGEPIEGAVFRAWATGRQLNATTDADGRFEIVDILGQQNSLHPTISHPDYVAKDGFSQRLEPDGVTEVEWRLDPGAVVTGRVVSKADGKPVKGIEIVSGTDRFASNRIAPSTKTDEQGNYRLTGIKPGPAVVHAFSKSFVPVSHSVTTALDRTATADFEMEKGKAITGRVVDPDGNPVAGVTLAIDTINGSRMLDRRVNTNANGEFRYDNMPDSPVRIDMFKRDWVSKRDLSAVGGEHYDITLHPVVEHVVRVRRPGTDEPPKDVTAQIGYQWQGRDEIAWQDGFHYDGTRYDTTAGVFRIRLDEPSSAKRYWRFRVPGYRDVVIENPALDAPPQSLEVLLETVQTVRGKVISAETGTPLEGVMVALASKQDRLRLDHYVNFDSRSEQVKRFTGPRATTAADGSFELPAVGDDEAAGIDLVLFLPGSSFHYIRDAKTVLTGQGIDLPLAAGGIVEGRVLVAGEPLADERVHLGWIAPGDEHQSWDLPFGFGGQLTTDAEGKFRFAGLGPGRYRLSRVKQFDNPIGGGSMSMNMSGQELLVLPGETVSYTFEQPAGHTISGQTLAADGSPLGSCVVTLSATTGHDRFDAVRTDDEGNFAIKHVQPGSYRISADHYDYAAGQCGLGTQGATGSTAVNVEGDTSATIKLAPRAQAQIARTGAGGEAASLVGSVPPDFTSKLFGSEESFTLSDHFGKVVAIDFWATWCGPCMALMPEMKKLHETYKDSDDVVFVTVSLDQEEESLANGVRDHGIEFPVVFENRESSQAIASAFGVQGIPSSFVIGRDGRFATDKIHGSQLLGSTETAVKAPVDPAFAPGVKPARLVVRLSLDDEHTGLPGATIKLATIDTAGKTLRDETIRTPGAATQFTWLYPPLDDEGEIRVTVDAENMPSQEKTLASPTTEAEIAFTFISPREIGGTISVDDEGDTPTPVADVKVTAYRTDGFRRIGTADAEGRFAIRVLPGTYYVSFAGNDDFAPLTTGREPIEVAADGDPSPLALVACRTVTATGIVKDSDGTPVEGAQVRTTASETIVTTDADGRFELRGVPSRGEVQLYALKRPRFALAKLTNFDGRDPQELTLGEQQPGSASSLTAGSKMPKLTVRPLSGESPREWHPTDDRETLIVFAPLWHPATRDLLVRAKAWAEEHRAHLIAVSVDWSLELARRQANAWADTDIGELEILYAGPGGLEIAKDWQLHAPAQLYVVSADGKIGSNPSPDDLP